MIDSILYSIINGVVIFLLLQTDVIYEYFKYFNIKILKEYSIAKQAGINNNLIKFLVLNYNNFFTKLISCPYCLSFWFSLLICFFTNIKFFGLNYLTTVIIYFILYKTTKHE